MKIVTLLHFYQPYNQYLDILDRIVHESYLPITRGLLSNPKAKIVANVSGALLDLWFEHGHKELIDNFAELFKRGQVELTGSAKYHAILPLIPKVEVERQIQANREVFQKYFSVSVNSNLIKGFFPPEMAVSSSVCQTVKDNDFNWIAAPELSFQKTESTGNKVYLDKETGLKVLFRNKRVSSLMLSGVCRSAEDFIRETTDLHNEKYWFVVMDAETFGHHRIGHDKFLFEVLNNPFFQSLTATELFDTITETEEVDLRPSTWTNEEQDFWLDQEHKIATTEKSFILWKDPENPIHKIQWELTQFAVDMVGDYPDKSAESYLAARDLLDKAIASDQFWWASGKPWWSLEMIESGAFELKKVISTLDVGPQDMKKADDLYRAILDKAFEWQRSGYIRNKHLQNSSTYMKESFKKRAPAEWFNQMMIEFEDEMKKAAANHDYEKAIKWRDALIKIKNETDPYDVLHVVDELWTARQIPQLKPFLQYSSEELSEYIKDYLQPLTNNEE